MGGKKSSLSYWSHISKHSEARHNDTSPLNQTLFKNRSSDMFERQKEWPTSAGLYLMTFWRWFSYCCPPGASWSDVRYVSIGTVWSHRRKSSSFCALPRPRIASLPWRFISSKDYYAERSFVSQKQFRKARGTRFGTNWLQPHWTTRPVTSLLDIAPSKSLAMAMDNALH